MLDVLGEQMVELQRGIGHVRHASVFLHGNHAVTSPGRSDLRKSMNARSAMGVWR
jgi:hypothetical protein